MKHQRLAYVFVICVMAAMTACTHPAGSPPPSTGEEPRVIEEPRSGTAKSENEYFYFLATQSERRAGHADRAIAWLQKAIELDPESAYLRRELAAIFLQNKEENKALEVLDELLTKHPEDIKGLILYGGIQQLRKQNDAAIRAYEKVIAIDPSQEKIYSLLGGLYLESNQLDAAQRVLEKLVERFPKSYAGHFLLGRVYLGKAKPGLAENAFRRSAEADPESLDPLFELLKLAREQGRREDVLRLNHEILNRDPENSRAFLDLALYYRQAGMKSESEEILKRLGERSRSEFEVLLQVIQVYVDAKRFEEALYLVNGMLKAAPDSADLHHLKGYSLFGLKKNAEALPEFRQVTAESRFFQDAVVHIAFILQEQGKVQEAIEQLQEMAQKNPENVEYKYYLASIFEESGRYDEAENHLKQALAKDPENSRYLFRLGVVYDKQKKKESSIEAMRRVITLDPKNASALNYLGYTYADLGQNLDEAEQLILEALKYKPDDGFITDSLGWVYYKKGDYQKALRYLKKASEMVPEDPVILEHVGDAYLKLNDKPNALKYYQKSMSKREKEKDKDTEKIKEKEELKKKIRQLK
ncbi:MAG: tetratricopeptide repeat protein [Desulfobacterales bacterium]|nr:tetratricopeptide repeat protein [Desulfobacterales bacterium]